MVASSGQKKETAIKLNSEINTIGLKQNENSNKTFYRHLPDLTMNAISLYYWPSNHVILSHNKPFM